MRLFIKQLANIEFYLVCLKYGDDNAMRDINKALSAYAAANPYA